MFLVKTTLNHQLHQWFFRFYWLKHYLTRHNIKLFLVALSLGWAGIAAVQFAYPSNWAMPQTRISGRYAGFRKVKEVEQEANALNSLVLTLKLKDQTLSPKLEDIGISIDGAKTAQKVADYSWRQRLIPFSLITSRRHLEDYPTVVNGHKLATFAKTLAAYDKVAIDAEVKIENTSVNVNPAQDGYAYPASDVVKESQDLELNNDLLVYIFPKTVEAAISTKTAEEIAARARQRLATPFTITADGNELNIDGSTLASWMVFTPDKTKQTLTLNYDRQKIKNKLLSLSSKVYIAETPNRVTMLDGEVSGSKNGASGQALQMEASIDEVIVAAGSNQTQVSAKTQPVTPTTQITRSYTRSSKGLQALVDYWTKSHGGSYGVVLKTPDGQISASHNADKQFTSASIYKLYVAYVVYTRVANGQMSLDDPTSTGKTVSGCIEVMIVLSDNTCAVALGNMVGWESNDPALHAKGYGSTTLNSGSHLTTANDAATLVSQLQADTFVRSDLNSTLISLMKRQVFRTGIPAGSRGEVADKVGFLDGLYHDAAIVYHPKGTYILVVMSSGSSFSTISDLASQISAVMDQ